MSVSLGKVMYLSLIRQTLSCDLSISARSEGRVTSMSATAVSLWLTSPMSLLSMVCFVPPGLQQGWTSKLIGSVLARTTIISVS